MTSWRLAAWGGLVRHSLVRRRIGGVGRAFQPAPSPDMVLRYDELTIGEKKDGRLS